MFSAPRKPWSSPGKSRYACGQVALPERVDDLLGLGRRHDPVLGALEDQDRARDPLGEVQRRAVVVEVLRAPDTAR